MKALALALTFSVIVFSQSNPPRSQTAGNCSVNIQGNNNTGTLTCYGVDKKLADQINQLVMASKRDTKALNDISEKLDKLLESPTQPGSVIQQAPNGINIGPAAIAPNPQVNNFGPPPATITWTEQVTAPLAQSGSGEKVMTVHFRTDRSIPGAVIGVIFSGEVTMTEEYWKAHSPSLTPSGAYEIDIHAPLSRNGAPIPNSIALLVTLPSAFSAGQDLAVVVTSKSDVHVLTAIEIER